MFELLITLFTGGGAMGLGSIIKMGAGFLDSRAATNEARENRKLLQRTEDAEHAIEFQKAVMGDGEAGLFARHTRRMLALIGVSTLAVVTIHCVLFPYDAFITLPSVASSGEGNKWFSLGFITLYRGNNPIQLTTGHLALMNLGSLQMILGFYFAGRK